MAYGDMTTASSGAVASSSEYNKVIGHVDDLDTRLDTVETTVNATGTTGSGNSTLSTRLGTGVTTASTASSQLSSLQTLTTDTATNGGHGNVRLSDRLGTGVGTGTNVTTGNASSQLGDLRTRVTAVEAATGGTKPICRLYRTTTQSVTTATWTAVAFDAETTDASNAHTGSSSQFKPTTAGWYRITGLVSATAVAGSIGAELRKNGSRLTGSGYSAGYSGGTVIFRSVITTELVQLNGTTDFVELFGFVSPGTQFIVDAPNGAGCYLLAEWVSP